MSLLAGTPASAQVVVVPRRALGAYFLGQNVGQSVNAFITASRDGRAANAEITAKVEQARKAFWSAYDHCQGDPDNPQLQAAAEQFSIALWEKDMVQMILLLPEGPHSPAALMLGMMMGQADGGIPKEAKPEFDAWIIALREAMGVTDHGDGKKHRGQLAIPNPGNFAEVMEKAAPAYEAYKLQRDWQEYQRAGKGTADFFRSPDNLVFLMLKYQGKTAGQKSVVQTDEEAQSQLAALKAMAGEAVVAKAADWLYEADYEMLFIVSRGTASAYGMPTQKAATAFNIFIGQSSPELFAITSLAMDNLDWSQAQKSLHDFYEERGKEQVLALATKILTAPKDAEGRFTDEGPGKGSTARAAFVQGLHALPKSTAYLAKINASPYSRVLGPENALLYDDKVSPVTFDRQPNILGYENGILIYTDNYHAGAVDLSSKPVRILWKVTHPALTSVDRRQMQQCQIGSAIIRDNRLLLGFPNASNKGSANVRNSTGEVICYEIPAGKQLYRWIKPGTYAFGAKMEWFGKQQNARLWNQSDPVMQVDPISGQERELVTAVWKDSNFSKYHRRVTELTKDDELKTFIAQTGWKADLYLSYLDTPDPNRVWCLLPTTVILMDLSTGDSVVKLSRKDNKHGDPFEMRKVSGNYLVHMGKFTPLYIQNATTGELLEEIRPASLAEGFDYVNSLGVYDDGFVIVSRPGVYCGKFPEKS